jgi:hypothetical protein
MRIVVSVAQREARQSLHSLPQILSRGTRIRQVMHLDRLRSSFGRGSVCIL